jgi:hypothetical protein
MAQLEINELQDATAWDSDGTKLGVVNEVHLERATGLPGWVTVSLGLLNTREHFVPLAGSRFEGGDLHLGWTRDVIGDAPEVTSDKKLSADEERMLGDYYGL